VSSVLNQSPTWWRFAARCFVGAACWATFGVAAAQADDAAIRAKQLTEARPYVIGSGDVLQIIVDREPDASIASVVVRPDGNISVPMLRQATAAGLTLPELEKQLTAQFAKFIRDPDVTVLVREIHSEKVYVIGAVRKEGAITLQGPLTVLQALAEAGGLTDYAKRSKIYVLRPNPSEHQRLSFDYNSVIRGQHSEQNIVLQSGDSVVVPP
jgi:polysaccharide biosynthesis/export protein